MPKSATANNFWDVPLLNSCLPLKRFWTVRNDENMGQQPDASEAGTAPGLEVDDHSFQWFLVGDRGIYLSDNPEVLSKDCPVILRHDKRKLY